MSFLDITAHKMKCSKGDLSDSYTILQINGQLTSTFKHASPPRRGSEIFIKKLPRDVVLQDILEFVVHCGDIYKIRLLMDFSGYNRGYCFVTYFETTSARKAILTLNGEKMKGDFPVVVKLSFDNNKLEVRGIPPGISRNDIFSTMSEIIGEGLIAVITFKNTDAKMKNNNCVLKYDSHKHALEARKKVWPIIQLWGKSIGIDWAIPHEVLYATKLYFRHVPTKVTKSQLYDEVTKYIQPDIMINIFIFKGVGYFLFRSKADATAAFDVLRANTVCGVFVEYSFSKFYPQLQEGNNADKVVNRATGHLVTPKNAPDTHPNRSSKSPLLVPSSQVYVHNAPRPIANIYQQNEPYYYPAIPSSHVATDLEKSQLLVPSLNRSLQTALQPISNIYQQNEPYPDPPSKLYNGITFQARPLLVTSSKGCLQNALQPTANIYQQHTNSGAAFGAPKAQSPMSWYVEPPYYRLSQRSASAIGATYSTPYVPSTAQNQVQLVRIKQQPNPNQCSVGLSPFPKFVI